MLLWGPRLSSCVLFYQVEIDLREPRRPDKTKKERVCSRKQTLSK